MVRLQLRLRRPVWNADCSLILSQPRRPACGRLIRRAFTLHELPSLVEAIFSNNNASETIRSLLGDDAQTFVDVIDEVRPTSAHRESAD